MQGKRRGAESAHAAARTLNKAGECFLGVIKATDPTSKIHPRFVGVFFFWQQRALAGASRT